MLIVFGALLALFTVMGALYWFLFGGGRRYRGIAVMLFGALLLAIAAIAALGSNSSPSVVLVPGIALSVFLGWWGYRWPRWMPGEPSAAPILAAIAKPRPTVRGLRPEDVLGQWRFYVDVAGFTVMVDLQADGRYRQMIATNSGKLIDSPGGEWTLDGPNLEVSAYRSATQGETSRVRWFFGDCQSDLILFVKDDPQAETMLVAIRGEQDVTGEQVACGDDAAGSGANKPTRKASSRSSSLFVSHGRAGSRGRSAR